MQKLKIVFSDTQMYLQQPLNKYYACLFVFECIFHTESKYDMANPKYHICIIAAKVTNMQFLFENSWFGIEFSFKTNTTSSKKFRIV